MEFIDISSSIHENSRKNSMKEPNNSIIIGDQNSRGGDVLLTNAIAEMTNAVTTLTRIFVQQTPPVFSIQWFVPIRVSLNASSNA
ncbi:hypothetical protein PIB30_066181 [Stylosanthes scabra]|uniref:Uncharacterized protein n=1 Tax=Stylosanthes scabra TaxID=79078 RepID=A0ABU6ZKZ1_9FABA|nr:hypothetical protein [Stylosanthes scabra]